MPIQRAVSLWTLYQAQAANPHLAIASFCQTVTHSWVGIQHFMVASTPVVDLHCPHRAVSPL